MNLIDKTLTRNTTANPMQQAMKSLVMNSITPQQKRGFVNLHENEQVYSGSSNGFENSLIVGIKLEDNSTYTMTLKWKRVVKLGLSCIGNEKMQMAFKNLKREDLRKVRHEFVFSCLSGDLFVSDERLEDYTRLETSLTPDIITESVGKLLVIELGTADTDSSNLVSLRDKKMKKYEFICKEIAKTREKQQVGLGALIVSRTTILSPMRLSERQVQSVLTLMACGLKAESVAAGLGINRDEELNDEIKDLRDTVERFNVRWRGVNDKLLINEEMESVWKKMDERSSELRKKTLESLMLVCAKNVITDFLPEKSNKKFEEMMKREGRRDMKRVVQQVILCPTKSHDYETEKRLIITAGLVKNGNVMSKFWMKLRDSITGKGDLFKAQDTEEYEKDALREGGRETNRDKRIRGRIRIIGLSEIRDELALMGVGGKKVKDKKFMTENRKKSQEPFSYLVYTGDIERLIMNSRSLMKVGDIGRDFVAEETEFLRSMAKMASRMNIKDTKLDPEFLIKRYSRTEIGRSMMFLGELMEELNLSLNHFTKRNEFEVKKLPHYDAWLAIKSLGPSNHLFYSVAWKKNSFNEEFSRETKTIFVGEEVEVDDWCFSKFVSVDRHRISHLLFAFEKTCGLLGTWCEMFETTDPWSEPLTKKRNNVFRHFMMTVIVYLEDKAQTSGDLQNIRFAYMDVIKGYKTDPLKIYKKLDFRPKSRLLVWVHKRVLTAFKRMAREPPKLVGSGETKEEKVRREIDSKMDRSVDETEVSKDMFEGLISFVTGEEIPRYSIANNLSYLGVLHNRNEGDELTGFLKIFEKVIKMEMALRDSREEYMGWEEPSDVEDLRDHEFSPVMVRWFGEILMKRLNKKYGNYKERMEMKFAKEIKRRTADLYATFKASAIRSYPETSSAERNKRVKVIEAIFSRIRDIGVNPLKSIESLCRELRGEGGLFANLFKKLQIGGTREIFVLDIISRLVINWMETLSRVISEDCENEMLTKGASKMKPSEEHWKRVKRMVESETGMRQRSAIDSDDATTWAQKFVMPAFGALLNKILPENYWKVCRFVLNSSTLKVLELPEILLNKFRDRPNEETKSDQMRELRDQFFARSKFNDLIEEKGRGELKNRSNMMQGIKHYTSTLMASAKQFWTDWMWKRLVKQAFLEKFPNLRMHAMVTSKVSSDDSSCVRTIVWKENYAYEDEEVERFVNACLHFGSMLTKEAMKLFTAQNSLEKSTRFTLNPIEEFNSKWVVGNTVVSPIIKFVFASISIKVQSRMLDRQRSAANLRSQVVENGGTMWLASLVQELQCRVHYTCLGCNTNKHWSIYEKRLRRLMHPTFGMFCYEPIELCGLLGFDLAFYLLMKTNAKARRTHGKLTKSLEIDVDESGKPTTTLQLLMGGLKNYKNFRSRVNVPADWREIPEKTNNIEMLYRKPESEEEVLFEMYTKVMTPSTADSFSFSSDNKMHAASAYIYGFKSMTVRRKKGRDEWEKSKLSLLYVMDEVDEMEQPSFVDLKVLFPNSENYDRIIIECSTINTFMKRTKDISYASRQTKIYLPKNEMMCSLSLRDVVVRRWWKTKLKTRGTRTEHKSCWITYKTEYPWLGESEKETLQNERCPYSNSVALANFITSQQYMTKSVEFIAPVKRGLTVTETLRRVVKSKAVPGMVGFKVKRGGRTGIEKKLKNKRVELGMITRMLLISSSMMSEMEKDSRIVGEIMRKESRTMIEEVADLKDSVSGAKFKKQVVPGSFSTRKYEVLTQRQKKIECFKMGLYLIENNDKSAKIILLNMVRKLKKGIVGVFNQKQKYSLGQKSYEGMGQFTCEIDKLPYVINLSNDKLVSIKCRNVDQAIIGENGLRKLMFMLGVRKADESSERREGYSYDVKTFKVVKGGGEGRAKIIVDESLVGPRFSSLVETEKIEFVIVRELYGAIKLQMEINRGERSKQRITVMSFKLSMEEFTDTNVMMTGKKLKKAKVSSFWLNISKCPLKKASKFLLEVRNRTMMLENELEVKLSGLPDVKIDYEGKNLSSGGRILISGATEILLGQLDKIFRVERWIRDTMVMRAENLGMIDSKLEEGVILSDDSETSEDSGENESMISSLMLDMELDMDILQEAMDDEETADSSSGDTDSSSLVSFLEGFSNLIQVEDSDVFDEQEYVPPKLRAVGDQLERLHPFWDDILKMLRGKELKFSSIVSSPFRIRNRNYVNSVEDIVLLIFGDQHRPADYSGLIVTSDEDSHDSNDDWY